MEEALSRHLDGICTLMGGFLRGFDDPGIHLSPPAAFAADFRKLMNLAVLRQPGDKQLISYAGAVAAYRASPIQSAGISADPVSTMIQGLAEPSLMSPDLRRKLPLDALNEDLAALLRTPALHFHIAVSDRSAFFADLNGIAAAEGFPLAGSECPFCRTELPAVQSGQIRKCDSCLQALESVRPLPMAPAVAADVSFELLRRIVALDTVVSYQLEGKIVPLENGSGIS